MHGECERLSDHEENPFVVACEIEREKPKTLRELMRDSGFIFSMGAIVFLAGVFAAIMVGNPN